MTPPEDSSAPVRRARRGRLPLFPVLVAALFIGIVAIILLRRPWELPPLPTTSEAGNTADATAIPPLMFMSNRDGDWDIYALTPGYETWLNLTDNDADDAFPTYSSDGGAITFLSNRNDSADGRLDAFLMNADGSEAGEVVNDVPTIIRILGTGRINWDLRYSLAGASVLVSLRDLNLEVYRVERAADGSQTETNVSSSGAVDWFPGFSPDGARLAFASDRADGNQDIYLAQPQGEPLRLTTHPRDDLYPTWVDDGRLIFYSEMEGATLAGGAMPLYTLELAESPSPDGGGFGEGETAISRFDPGAEVAIRQAENMGTFAAGVMPLPGGGQIYMTFDGDWDIYYVDASGGAPVNLTEDDARTGAGGSGSDEMFPVWRPVGG